MFSTLVDYCNWDWAEDVEKLLETTHGVDITQKECECIRLAIARNSPVILKSLLEYFNSSTSTEIQRSKIGDAFHEYIDFEDLSLEMMQIVSKYLPFVAQAALIDRAANDDVDTVRILYQYFPEAENDILEVVVSHEAYNVMDLIAQVQVSESEKAMVYCDIADILSRNGMYGKSYEFYGKAITADPSYIIYSLCKYCSRKANC